VRNGSIWLTFNWFVEFRPRTEKISITRHQLSLGVYTSKVDSYRSGNWPANTTPSATPATADTHNALRLHPDPSLLDSDSVLCTFTLCAGTYVATGPSLLRTRRRGDRMGGTTTPAFSSRLALAQCASASALVAAEATPSPQIGMYGVRRITF
jgi:hypothetical protein